MRPLLLSMQAFGPYAGNQTVDFNELAGRQFFLIHGPTGAGKTTILDAMCFALYGTSSGAEREGSAMRSDHADPATPTEVTFDFAVGPTVYRVRRRPKQERPKKRGGGTTTDEPQAALWKLTADADPKERKTLLAGQWERCTQAVEEILGFKSAQFRQVVMLPQGQFRQLLAADSRERQKILETLFHTEIYRIVEERLKETAKEIENDAKDCRRRIDLVLGQTGAANLSELTDMKQSLEAACRQQEDSVGAARQEEAAAQTALNEGARIIEKLGERDAAQQSLKKLEEQSSEFAAKRVILDAGRRALSLLDVEETLKKNRQERETLSQAMEDIKAQLQTVDMEARKAEESLRSEVAREPEREAALHTVNDLEGLKTKVTDLEQAREVLRKADISWQLQEARRQRATEALAALRKNLEEETQARTEAAAVAAQMPALTAIQTEAKKLLQQRRQYEEMQNALAAATKQYDAAQAKRLQAEQSIVKGRRELTETEHLWQAAQAAVLAEGLIAGEPCPVCGSLDHPAPALSDTPVPKEQALRKLRTQLEKQEQDLTAIRDGEQKISLEVERHKANAVLIKASMGEAGELSLTQLEGREADAGKALALANEAQTHMKTLAESVEALKNSEAQGVRTLEEVEKDYQTAVIEREKQAAVVAEREAGIPKAWREAGALERDLKKAAARLDMFKNALNKAQEQNVRVREAKSAAEATLAEKSSALNASTEKMQLAGEEFRKRLTEAGFDDEAAFQAAERSAGKLAQIEKEIITFDRSKEAAKDRLMRATQAAEGLTAPDMENLSAKLQAVKENLTALMTEQADHNARIKLLDGALKNVADYSSRLETLEARYAVFGRLSEVAGGKNNYGMTFQRFVLAALLDDVLTAASARLKMMSRGRYELHRIRDKSKRPSGLELEVYDAYTGTMRGVATLSGGESFLASLSLALGLADVVQSYAGGIHLDTIFIDEGFGSLDPEALEQAMRALIDLQKGGRLVGVISHVPEMKEWIGARLEITSGRRGSEARFILQ